ncbi:MAG: DMT family transporter [Lentisphaeraceae bacterium]|nr:DMT family transporter [Lentisphaeraceae bacterium]
MIRYLKDKEHPATIILFFSLFSVAVSLPLMLWQGFVMPRGMQWFYILMIGVTASGGQICITNTYKYAPAAKISIYTSIIFACILGYLLWKEVPDALSIIGMVIISSIAYLLFWNNRKKS